MRTRFSLEVQQRTCGHMTTANRCFSCILLYYLLGAQNVAKGGGAVLSTVCGRSWRRDPLPAVSPANKPRQFVDACLDLYGVLVAVLDFCFSPFHSRQS